MDNKLAKNSNHKSNLTRRTFLQTVGAATSFMAFPSIATSASRTIKIGFVGPKTGFLSAFAVPQDYINDVAMNKVLKKQIVIGSTKYAVELIVKDTQSNQDRASNVAADLIHKDGVDFIMTYGGDTSIPVAQQCELNGVPCLSTLIPWEAWLFPMGGNPGKWNEWSFHFNWGLHDLIEAYMDIWKIAGLEKEIATIWPNDPGGAAFDNKDHGFTGALPKAGFKVTNIGRFQPTTQDFTAHIQAFKKAKPPYFAGLFAPPTFATFWTQALQLGFNPQVATIGLALLFPSAVEALGERGHNLSVDVWWNRSYPSSSLTGQTAAQIVGEYQDKTNQQWTQPLGGLHALWEIAASVLKNSGDPKNKKSVSQAIRNTKLNTTMGLCNFKETKIANVATNIVVGGQWRREKKKLGKYELYVVANAHHPEVPIERSLELIKYT